MTTFALTAVFCLVVAYIIRQPARLAALVPVCEIKDSVVLTNDGGLAVGFVLDPLVYNACSRAQVKNVAASLSTLLRRLEDGVVLQLIVDVKSGQPDVVKDFITSTSQAAKGDSAAAALCLDVAEHARKQHFRQTSFYLLVCCPYAFQRADVKAARRTMAKPRWDGVQYEETLAQVRRTAQTVREHLSATGIITQLASDAELLSLVQSHLNPGRTLPAIKDGTGRDAVADAFSKIKPEMRQHLTLRESLVATHFEMPTPQVLVAGDTLVRVMSMKALPDETFAGMLAPLFFELPEPSRLSFSIEKLPTELTLAKLKTRRSMAASMARSATIGRNIDADVQQRDIEEVMTAVSQSATSFCSVQLCCAVYGDSMDELKRRASWIEQTFGRAGGLSTLVEDHAHLDAYLSMLPGASHTFRRNKTVLDINAAEVAIPYGSWAGDRKGSVLLRSRTGQALVLNPFSPRLDAWNGLVIGGTGAGKSFITNQIGLQVLARGGRMVIIDVGGSYKPLTAIWGGSYFEVGKSADVGMNPFCVPRALADLGEEKRTARMQFMGGALELLMTEHPERGMPTSERAIISKTLRAFYDVVATKARWDSLPQLRDYQQFMVEYCDDLSDKSTAVQMARRLNLWIEGPRAHLFERGMSINLDEPVIAIDLKPISDDKELQAFAIYVLSLVINERVSAARTMVVFDECWKMLANPAAMALVNELVRTLRKTGSGMWCISQGIGEFSESAIGPALMLCSHTRVLLRHADNHEETARRCGLPDHALSAFQSLTSVKGHYSEAVVQTIPITGTQTAELVQLVPSPLSYWMATTDPADRAAEANLRKKNPAASNLRILKTLAKHLPHGAQAA